MLYCKSSKFLKSLDEIDVDKRLVDLIGDVTADRLLLGIRNGNLRLTMILTMATSGTGALSETIFKP